MDKRPFQDRLNAWTRRITGAVLSLFRRNIDLWTSLVGVFLVGILCLVIASLKKETFASHVVQELGLACIIAVVVALIFELRISRHIAAGSLNAIMGVATPKAVWDEIREHIISAAVIREDYHIHIVLDDDPRRDGLYGVRSTVRYRLKSLKHLHSFDISHTLDPDLTGKENGHDLPRFLRATVGKVVYSSTGLGEDLGKLVDESGTRLRIPIHFTRVDETVTVDIESRALMRIPDTSSMWMTATTCKPTVTIQHRTEDVDFKVWACHPHPEDLSKRGETWEFDGIMLPGQGFEVHSVGCPSLTRTPPEEFRELLEVYNAKFAGAQPVLREWIIGTFSALTRIMGEGWVALPLDDAPKEIAKVYGHAKDFIIATNVGSTKFYFDNPGYVEGNQKAGAPIIRFYLYSSKHAIELRSRPGRDVTKIDDFVTEVEELHKVLGTLYSAVIDMDSGPAFGAEDMLLLDNKFLFQTRVDDKNWSFFQARATEEAYHLREARRYLTRLMASVYKHFTLDDEAVRVRFPRLANQDADLAECEFRSIRNRIGGRG